LKNAAKANRPRQNVISCPRNRQTAATVDTAHEAVKSAC
jgi:hypothetical protein